MILVEWCPLPDAPPLADALAGLSARVITVPLEVARERFEQADEIALWIFAAKNVGIRRARAPFILATNPDVLYTPALFRAVAKGALDRDAFYRTSRLDVDGVPLDAPPRRQLGVAARSIIRANLVGGSIRLDPPGGGRRLARAVRAYEQTFKETAPATMAERTDRPTDWIHTNASGDFFLMHRDRWAELHGYPEFASAGHLDSYICVMAAAAGLRQRILGGRKRLYHLEHERAIDWERPEGASHYYVPYETFLDAAQTMLRAGAPTLFNGESWGLGGAELPEADLRILG